MLLAIITLAAFLRFIWIGTFTPHFDELWHLELSTGRGSAHLTMPRNVIIPNAPDVTALRDAPPWWAIWNTLSTVTHPPLFPLLLRGWRVMFGESLAVGRSLSAVFGVVSVLVFFDVVRLLARSTAFGLWAAAIFAVSSAQIEISQDLRNYELATFAMLLTANAIARILMFGPSLWRAVALSIAALLAMLSHYFVAPIMIAIGLFALIYLRGGARRQAVVALLIAGLFFTVLWGPNLRRQILAVQEASAVGSFGDWKNSAKLWALQRLATLPLRQLFEPRWDAIVPAVGSATLFLIPWAMLFCQRRQHRKSLDDLGGAETAEMRPVDPALLFWALWLTSIALMLVTLDLTRATRHLDQLRHTIFAGPAVVGGLVAIGGRFKKIIAHGLPAFVFLACVLSLGLTYTRQNPSFPAVGETVAQTGLPDVPIVFYSAPEYLWLSDVLFLGVSHYAGTFPRPIVRLDKPASGALLEQLRAMPKLIAVVGGSKIGPKEILPGCIDDLLPPIPYIGRVSIISWRKDAGTEMATPSASEPWR